MKLIFVNPTRLQRPLYMVAKGLADRGHQVSILQPYEYVQRYPAWDNVPLIPVPSFYLPEIRYPLPNLKHEYDILSRLVREQGYQLIHAYDYQNLTTLPPILIKKKYKIPITLVNNALVGITYKYGTPLFDFAAKSYSKTLGRFILRSYDRLFYLFDEEARQAERLVGKNSPSWKVIPNGIDVTQFYRVSDSSKRAELGISPSEKVILYVGRLLAVKRIELLIELTQQLLSRNLPVRMVIVGGGSFGNQKLEERYRQMAEPFGKAVIFTGPKKTNELRDYYSIADVAVLPSLSEGLPASVLEAGACEVPSVASDVGGVNEIIAQGQSGYVFSPHDVTSFINYVEDILKDDTRAREMGKKARDIIWAKYHWDRIVDLYEQIFTDLVQAKNQL